MYIEETIFTANKSVLYIEKDYINPLLKMVSFCQIKKKKEEKKASDIKGVHLFYNLKFYTNKTK